MTATSTDKSTACTVCNAPMPAGASRCESCGATRGVQHKCPFCGAIAEAQPHPKLRFACPVCGAPRIPTSEAAQPPAPDVVASLRKARSARASSAAWKIASLLGAVFGSFSVLLLVGVALIASPSLFPLLAAALVASSPLLFALVAWMRAGAKQREVQDALDEAWLQAAHELAATRKSIRAPQLATALGVDTQQAQALLAKLSARDDVSTEITDEGELALSVRYPSRIRVEAAPAAPDAVEEEVEHEVSPRRKAGA